MMKIIVNRFLDWLLIKLTRRRWGMLYKDLSNKEITGKDYAIRRRYYESFIWEIEKKDLK